MEDFKIAIDTLNYIDSTNIDEMLTHTAIVSVDSAIKAMIEYGRQCVKLALQEAINKSWIDDEQTIQEVENELLNKLI